MPASRHIADARQLLRAEYLTNAALLLTPGEAAALMDLNQATALSALEALEGTGFLVLTTDGRFARSPDRRPAIRTVPSGRRQAG